MRVSSGTQWRHWHREIRGERPAANPQQLAIWGYAGRPSYAPGDTLTLHVSTTAKRFEILIYRDGGVEETVYRATDLAGGLLSAPEDAYAAGARHVTDTASYRSPPDHDPLSAVGATESLVLQEGPGAVAAVILERVQNAGG